MAAQPQVRVPSSEYAPPALIELGTAHELTLTGSGHSFPCIWHKTVGPADYISWIPITRCSS
jgi:hypothetical protein